MLIKLPRTPGIRVDMVRPSLKGTRRGRSNPEEAEKLPKFSKFWSI